MKFSTRTLYGLRAVLVLASRFGQGSLSVSWIAKKENISIAYLEQILNALKKKDLVKSVRGPQGGYVLAKKPSELSLEALLTVLDAWPDALQGSRKPTGKDFDEVAVANFLFWSKLKSAIQKNLSGIYLSDLMHETRSLRKAKASPHSFQI